ncbi:MAG: chemotaxis protein CheW [Desulfobulbaceae bacterium]|nr:chemotaxis protein CheW [Desulfobulbaceae bacterium]
MNDPSMINGNMRKTGAAEHTASGVDIALLKEEMNAALFDDELHQIFLAQLQDNISQLRTLTADFTDANTPQFINQCSELISRLHSFASYMGYDRLTGFFGTWIAGLESGGRQTPTTSRTLLDFMETNLRTIDGLLPQQENMHMEKEKTLPPAPGPGEQSDGDQEEASPENNESRDLENFSAVYEAIFAEESLQLEDSYPDEEDNSPDDADAEDDSSDYDQPAEDTFPEAEARRAELFEKLSSVLESLADNSAIPPDDDVPGDAGSLQQEDEIPAKHFQHGQNASPDDDRLLFEKLSSALDADLGSLLHSDGTGEPYEDQNGRQLFARLSSALEERNLARQTTSLKSIDDVIREILTGEQLSDSASAAGKQEQDAPEERADSGFRMNRDNIQSGRDKDGIPEKEPDAGMLPLAHIFLRLPEFVQNLVRQTGKKLKFVIRGQETLVDKITLESIYEPLAQIIRNSIYHSIETPAERRQAGKDATALLLLKAFQDNNSVVIEISDDGRGMSARQIKDDALRLDLFPPAELDAMSEAEILRLIMTPGYQPGPGTAGSGDKADMDAVSKTAAFNGTVDIRPQPGSGTTISLRIPLPGTVMQILGIKAGSVIIAVPLGNIEEAALVKTENIIADGEIFHIRHRDALLPGFTLTELLDITGEAAISSCAYLLVVKEGEHRAGLLVNGFTRPAERVINPLAESAEKETIYSGIITEEDGTSSRVLDMAVLMDIAGKDLLDKIGDENQLTPEIEKILCRLSKSQPSGQE